MFTPQRSPDLPRPSIKGEAKEQNREQNAKAATAGNQVEQEAADSDVVWSLRSKGPEDSKVSPGKPASPGITKLGANCSSIGKPSESQVKDTPILDVNILNGSGQPKRQLPPPQKKDSSSVLTAKQHLSDGHARKEGDSKSSLVAK